MTISLIMVATLFLGLTPVAVEAQAYRYRLFWANGDYSDVQDFKVEGSDIIYQQYGGEVRRSATEMVKVQLDEPLPPLSAATQCAWARGDVAKALSDLGDGSRRDLEDLKRGRYMPAASEARRVVLEARISSARTACQGQR